MMGKAKHKISNWKEYNQALVNLGFVFSDTGIDTALMVKCIFKRPLCGLEGFFNLVFTLMNIPLKSLIYTCTYTCMSKRSKTVKVKYCFQSLGAVVYVVIDVTGPKVYIESEWKTRKHGKEKWRI
ncbi:transposase [Candidatus Enterovibrio escicola]|uniref:transposase n=1 Tax=Candidatus Enterovibrio escicola TaxID=1927127 RepID=UPI001237CB16|nr:transposase [Candidatus Enterovibrio escacola]